MTLTIAERERAGAPLNYARAGAIARGETGLDARTRPSADEDARLVRGVLAGESGAFEALVARHSGPVGAVARRFVRDPNDLDDVVQETFLRAYRSLRRYRGGSAFRTWLIQIALNVCRDQRRTFWSRRVELAEDRALLAETAGADGFSRDFLLRQALHRAIAELPERLMVPFVLNALEELSGAEIAAVLGCNESTVWTRIYTARKRLRAQLGDLLEA
jgi:RNA polymerase sigma-70 factor (ECF subfamily)